MLEPQKVLKTLTPREEDVLRKLHGLDGSPVSRKSLAQELEVTWQKIVAIEKKALRKLRHPSRRRMLEALLGSGANIDELNLAEIVEPLRTMVDPENLEEQRLAYEQVVARVRELTPELIAYLKTHHDDLDVIPPDVFEHLIAEFFASWGWDDVGVVGRRRDTSADVIAGYMTRGAKTRVRTFIEVKRRGDRVGVEVVDRVLGAVAGERSRFGWTGAMIVSTVGFREFRKYGAADLRVLGLELRERSDLVRWLDGYSPNERGLWLPDPTWSGEI